MNQVKKKSFLAIKTITYEGQPCNTFMSLWNALYSSYNSAENYPVNTNFLNEVPQSNTIDWLLFSKQEFRNAIAKCFSFSIPSLDHVSWRYLKPLIADNKCLEKIVYIANVCIKHEFQLSQFKTVTLVVIPKPNKELYNTPKSFQPIILLNITDKLIKKVISTQLQFHITSNNFLNLNQFSSIKQQSTINTGLLQ